MWSANVLCESFFPSTNENVSIPLFIVDLIYSVFQFLADYMRLVVTNVNVYKVMSIHSKIQLHISMDS